MSATRRESMIIIGGGLGGLSTGCYAQMNGYRTRIFELHELPGGCCTSWERGAFTFDWCVSWLLGSGPGSEMHQIWLELGALQGKQIRQFDTFNTVRFPDGRAVRFYSAPERLQAHLLEHSPADAALIREFCNGVRRFQRCIAAYPFLRPVGMMGRLEKLRMLARFLPYFNLIRKSIGVLMRDFSQRFQSPYLREAFNFILYEKHPNFPVLPFYFQLACHANGAAGVPEGGSLGLARSIEARYRRLGGEILYNARVEQILVENDRAVGVRLSNGECHRAQIVVSACDGYSTVMKLLGGRYLSDTLRRLYTHTIDQPDMLFPGYLAVFLGLEREPQGLEACTTFLLSEQEAAALPGIRHPSINVQLRSMHYPELAPAGQSIIYASYFCDIAPWRALTAGAQEQRTRLQQGQEVHTLPVRRGRGYHQAKAAVARFVVDYLDQRYPGLAASVRLRDVTTPLTQVRYTANYNGTVLGWQPFVESGETLEQEINSRGPVLPGLADFYMSSVWVTTGGLIRAAASGRQVMQFICRDDALPFDAQIDDAAAPPVVVQLAAAREEPQQARERELPPTAPRRRAAQRAAAPLLECRPS